MPIRKLKARQIIDARGEPTVEVDLVTEIGLLRSSVPSKVLACENEAKEVRDGEAAAYNGRSVFKVLEAVNNVIAPELLKSKLDVNQQREIDLLLRNLDGTADKSKLGANAMLGVSMACCKASAAKRGLPLYRYIASLCENNDINVPVPVFTVISGGRAAGNNLAYQGLFIMPTGAESFAEAMKMAADTYHALEQQLAEALELKLPLATVNSGTFAPELEDDAEALTVLSEAIKAAGHEGKIKIGIDVVASAFCKDGMYDLGFKTGESEPEEYLDADGLGARYAELLGRLPALATIEEPFDQDDWDSWSGLTSRSAELQVLADELVATRADRLEEAIERQAANSLLVKLSHVGTVSEALDCAKAARAAGWAVAVGAGQGETEDTFVADFAVGVSASLFKAGPPCRNAKLAKYNQILRIEEELGSKAVYVGERFRKGRADE